MIRYNVERYTHGLKISSADSATAFAVIIFKGIACGQRVNIHAAVQINLAPPLFFGNGLTRSKAF